MLKQVLGTFGAAATLVAFSTITATPAKAATFELTFDNTFANGSGVTPPFTGTGTLSYQGNIQPGQFTLSSLTGLDFNFTVNGTNFTTAHLTSSLDTAFLLVQAIPGGYQAFLGGGSLSSGSVAFFKPDGSHFSFEPSAFDGTLDQYIQGNVTSYPANYFNGSYQAIYQSTQSVPEPTTLLGLAVAGSGLIATKRKRSSVTS